MQGSEVRGQASLQEISAARIERWDNESDEKGMQKAITGQPHAAYLLDFKSKYKIIV